MEMAQELKPEDQSSDSRTHMATGLQFQPQKAELGVLLQSKLASEMSGSKEAWV